MCISVVSYLVKSDADYCFHISPHTKNKLHLENLFSKIASHSIPNLPN